VKHGRLQQLKQHQCLLGGEANQMFGRIWGGASEWCVGLNVRIYPVLNVD